MTPSRGWFLPQTPDVVGALVRQMEVTAEGMDAFEAWAAGEEDAGRRVRDCEHRADQLKRELRTALTEAFTTPLGPEDLFELSLRLDDVLNGAKNTVREAEVMRALPDEPMATMAGELAEGTRKLAEALAAVDSGRLEEETAAADAAVKSQRRVEHTYREAMSALLLSDDLDEVTARRELYRRMVRISDHLAGVAQRVWYSLLKES